MIKNRTKQKCLYLLFAVFVGCIMIFLNTVMGQNNRSNAESIPVHYAAALDYYIIEEYDETCTVKDPLGNTVQTDENGGFVLEHLGIYEIYWEEQLREKVHVFAENPETKFTDLFSNANNLKSATFGADWSENFAENNRGLELVSSGINTYIYYGNVIDLNDLGKDDILISMYAEKSDRSSMSNLKVTLIDVNDENNYFSVSWRQNTDYTPSVYMTVEFNNYSVGVNTDTGLLRPYYGTVIYHSSFVSTDNAVPHGFRFDCRENAVYSYKGDVKVIDMDDAAMLEGRTPFRGFSTDKVYLKIETTASDSAILVNNFLGKPVDDVLNFNLANDELLRFTYDGDYLQSDELHAGLVNRAYSLPVPVEKDLFDSSYTVDMTLYQPGGDGWEDITDTVVHAVFTPKKIGTYRVVYEGSFAGKGERISKEFLFEVTDTEIPIIIEAEDSIAEVRSLYHVPQYSAEGGSGKITLTTEYLYNGREVFPDANGELFLDEPGEIKVTLTATDFLLTRAEKIVKITVQPRAVLEISEIPVSLFAGREYMLPDFTAIDYRLLPDVEGYEMSKCIFVNGIKIGEDRLYTPNEPGLLQIEYVAGLGTEKELRQTVEVPVLRLSDNFDISDYLATSGEISETLFHAGLRYDFSGNAVIAMPAPIPADSLEISFSLIENSFHYESIEFILEDYIDPAQQLVLTVSGFKGKDLNATTQRLAFGISHGGLPAELNYSRARYGSNTIYPDMNYYSVSVRYYATQKTFTDGNDRVLKTVTTTQSGKVFTGFASGLVRVKIRLNGGTADSAFVLNAVSNQVFTTYGLNRGDRQGPVIGFTGEIPSESQKGDSLSISSAVAYDVLQGAATSFSLTIKGPDGKLISNQNPAETFSLRTEDYGVYVLTYQAEDFFGNISTHVVNIRVRDRESPTLTATLDRTEYAVGESFSVPQFSAQDNVGVANQYAVLRTPTTEMVLLRENYTFVQSGMYVLIFYAEDEEGNFNTQKFTLTVN